MPTPSPPHPCRIVTMYLYDDGTADVVSLASPVQAGPVIRQDSISRREAVVLVADIIAPGETFDPPNRPTGEQS